MAQGEKSIFLLFPGVENAFPAVKCLAIINYGNHTGTILHYKQIWRLLVPAQRWQSQFTAMLPCPGTAVCADLM